ncbi:MAG TPA: Minf_1886 family protein [Chthoniobacteraceae bacterium]|nr:Minf_1886 family protein [Chthoniobacteraceae bacterium]
MKAKIGFSEAVANIMARDTRYESEAYTFVRDALDFTIKLRKKGGREEERQAMGRDLSETVRQNSNVNGPELLAGVRQYALKEFGPMVMTVFSYWGIQRCEDVGAIVFNLIDEGIFGKSEHDTIDDFKNGFNFHEAFVEPFLPPEAPARRGQKGAPVQKSK